MKRTLSWHEREVLGAVLLALDGLEGPLGVEGQEGR